MANAEAAGCFGGSRPFQFLRSNSSPPTNRADSLPESSKPNQNGNLHPAVEAVRSGRLAISFSGGGFLLPFFVGVADGLQQVGVLRPDGATPLAGSSAGSIVAVCIACGLTPTQMFNNFLVSVRDCRLNGSARRLEEVVRRDLETTLPPDAAERCNGVVTVGVTTLFPHPRTRRISVFTSRADLIDALLASCHIPRYFNGNFTRSYRGKISVDGGMTGLMPKPKSPHDFLLKVCCFAREHVTRLPVMNRRRALKHLSLGITPDAFQPWPHSLRDTLAVALHPGDDAFLEGLLAAGRRDALQWAAAAVGMAPPPPSPALGTPAKAAAAPAVAAPEPAAAGHELSKPVPTDAARSVLSSGSETEAKAEEEQQEGAAALAPPPLPLDKTCGTGSDRGGRALSHSSGSARCRR